MLSLEAHHIIDVYVFVDDNVPKDRSSVQGGRPVILSRSEIITIVIWNTLVLRQKTIKDIYRSMQLYHQHDFPNLPSYQTFVRQCHAAIPTCLFLLQQLLATEADIRIMDATMLPVCTSKRAGSHRVASGLADFGKNWQGWHFGFNLHASINLRGSLCAIALTPASVHDAQAMPNLLNEYARFAVGDTLYGARVMGRFIWERYGTIIIAPPHPKQNKKLMTDWQFAFLRIRSKIESVFDYLKQHLHLVSSFPRSITGYLFHYVRILLGYQILAFPHSI